MCGILGGLFNNTIKDTKIYFENGLAQIDHRGPDDKGYKIYEINNNQDLYLGHTRLAILDLSNAGRQPMSNNSGDMTIIFNGEIYNYKELRIELQSIGYTFNTKTDTEVLLNSFQHWGVSCLKKLKGMFAFCILDHKLNKLTLARDAFGIKPLFYTQKNDRFIFSSEIPPILSLLDEKISPDLQSAYDYLVHGDYDSNERTFFSGILHLMPATYVEFDLNTSKLTAQKRWWLPNIKEDKSITFDNAKDEIKQRFLQNVKLHLRSDVPIGAALSGGLDSSSIVCAMRYLDPNIPIHTFSYIAQGSVKSEEKWVDIINAEVNAIPHKVVATPNELISDLDDLIKTQGEPFGSASIYAQYRVFKIAKQHGITVTLDGQGADELLAGYIGYPGERLLSFFEKGELINALKFSLNWSKYPDRTLKMAWMYFLKKILPDFMFSQARKLYGRDFKPSWLNIELLEHQGVKMTEKRNATTPSGKSRRVVEMLANSLYSRGLSGLLRHGDRNSMRFSIESRVPFLTIDFAEYLYTLPESYLISDNGETKHVFKAAMKEIVPEVVLSRKDKIGFDPDDQDWKGFYIEEIYNTKQSTPCNIINFNHLLKKPDSINKNTYWRILNYIKWHAIFIKNQKETNNTSNIL